MPQMAWSAERHDKHGVRIQVVLPMRHRQRAAVGVERLAWPPALLAALLALPIGGVFDGASDLLPVYRVEVALHGHGVTYSNSVGVA